MPFNDNEINNTAQNWQPLIYEPYTEEELLANEEHYFSLNHEQNDSLPVSVVGNDGILNNSIFTENGSIPNLQSFEPWDKVLLKAQKGDMIEFHRGFYRHWAIFEGCTKFASSSVSSTVIHVRAPNGRDLEDEINSIKPVREAAKTQDSLSLNFPRFSTYLSSIPTGSLSSFYRPIDSFVNPCNGNTKAGRADGPSIGEAFAGTTAVISRDLLCVVAGDDPVRINNKMDQVRARNLFPFPPPVIVRNALALLNQDVPYQALTLNCEHYVTTWRYGVGWSDQSRDTTLKVLKAGQTLYDSYFTDKCGIVEAVKKACRTFKSVKNEDFC